MKLISLYIENFGTLSKYSYSFNDKINILFEKNGFGKTTLAAFIKAMFYGLPSNKKNNIDDNDRKKYRPWNNLVFGGNITFEVNAITYRIERTFSDQPKKDSFKLINLKTNQLSNDFSSKIGEELFALDADAYLKSTYIPQDFKQNLMNETIRTKLTNLVSSSNDLTNYDDAIKKLEDKRKIYYKNGNKGLIFDNENSLSKLKEQINDLLSLKDKIESNELELEKKNSDIIQLKSQVSNLEAELLEANKQATNEEIKNHYFDIKNDIDSKNKELDSLINSINNQSVSDETLNSIKDKIEKLKEIDIKIKEIEKDVDYINYNETSKLFKRRPTQEEITTYSKKAFQFNNLVYTNSLDSFQLKQFEQLKTFFNSQSLSEETIDDYIKQYSSLSESSENINLEKQKNNLFIALSFALLIILFGLSGFLLLQINKVIGISFLSLALISLILQILFLFKYFSIKKKNTEIKKNSELTKQNTLNSIIEFLNIFYKDIEKDYLFYLNDLKNKRREFIQLNSIYEKDEKSRLELNSTKEQLIRELDDFLKDFSYVNNNYYDIIQEINNNLNNLIMLEQKVKSLNNEKQVLLSTSNSLKSNIENYFNVFYITFTGSYLDYYNLLISKLNKIDELKNNLHILNKKLNDYVKDKSITKELLEETKTKDVDEIQNNIRLKNENTISLIEEKSNLENTIKHQKDEYDKIQDLQDEESNLNQTIINDKHQLDIIKKTIDFLENARANLSSNYIKSLEKNFSKYLKLVTNNEAKDVVVDTELNLSFDENGQRKEINYYSKGYKDIFDFCMRCALVESLFKDEIPFLILDDPFVNLDEEKLELTKKLLKTLSHKYQILYLVCHNSRV